MGTNMNLSMTTVMGVVAFATLPNVGATKKNAPINYEQSIATTSVCQV
jgi:hypothetical protein